jgi:hypothetical protein
MASCIGRQADQKILAVAHERRRRFAWSSYLLLSFGRGYVGLSENAIDLTD